MEFTGDWTQDIVHTKHILYHWTIPFLPPRESYFRKAIQVNGIQQEKKK